MSEDRPIQHSVCQSVQRLASVHEYIGYGDALKDAEARGIPITIQTMHTWRRTGKLPAVQNPPGTGGRWTCWYVRRDHWEKWIAAYRTFKLGVA